MIGVIDTATYVTELRRVPQGWYAVVAIALGVVVCWLVVGMYRREGRMGASMPRRMLMAAVRCAVLVTMGLILLDPVRVRILRRWIESYTIVLLDTSASMDLVDRYRDEQTAARVQAVMQDPGLSSARRIEVVERIVRGREQDLLQQLAANNSVKLYAFDDDPQALATYPAAGGLENTNDEQRPSPSGGSNAHASSPDRRVLPDRFEATGPATNLERALREAVETLGSAPIAGVVVLTDGGINTGGNIEEIARYAGEWRLPVHVVGIGDPTTPRNLRVTEVLAPENALQKDPFALTATLATEGLQGERVRVELVEQNVSSGGEPKVVAARDILIGAGGAVPAVTFERQPESVGRYTYTVQVPPLPDETIAEDNSRQITVNVIDARTRALLVSGEPSWTYRYLTTLLQRDDTIDVSCWLQSADMTAVRDGDTIIDHLPNTAEELFAYDVIVLLDPDKTDLDSEWVNLVDQWVTKFGGGLLYAAARPHTPAFLRDPTFKGLVDLLPVSLDPEADLILNQIGHYQTAPSSVELVAESSGHPILRASDDAQADRSAWQAVAEVYWHYPVLREKPVATVLMRHGNPRMRNSYGGHVLAAVQYAGTGRTGFLAFDGTWRWRKFGPEWFERFWIQSIRYLAEGKLLGGKGRGALLVDKDRPSIGEAVVVSARLLNQRFEPVREDHVAGWYESEGDRREFTLSATPQRPGWFEGRFVPDRAGRYRIGLSQNAFDSEAPLERDILVSRPNLEIVQPQLHRDRLLTLAERSFGGRYWEVDQVADLVRAIPDQHQTIQIRSRPVSLWDNGKMLAVLVVLLGVEWSLRKWNRLL